MKVEVISKSRDLYRLCREIGAQFRATFPEEDWDISLSDLHGAHTGSDLYILDFHPDLPLPAAASSRTPVQEFLFLVQRKDLELFREKVSDPEAHVLLKPVSRPALAAFMAHAGGAHRTPPALAAAGGTLRTDRDEVLQFLIQTNLTLQEYDQDRTNFLTRAVHDFRAPLTALCGYCGLLLAEQLGALNANQKDVLQRMHHSAKRLSRMASAMFQLSVGRHVETRPQLQRGDLRECLDQALHEVSPAAQEKHLNITVDLSPSPEPLYFELPQIEQVLINLLDNACKFTPKFGSIEIRGYPFFWERRLDRKSTAPSSGDRRHKDFRVPNVYRLDIQDSGPAIPMVHLNRIFEEYSQYSGGEDRSGGGLGLAICRMIMAQHQGWVWAESGTSGAVLSFVLPFYRGALPSDGRAVETEFYPFNKTGDSDAVRSER